ncbi:hypothetical protein HDF25_001550 [Pedobacter cryoconitis]|uniref:Uncharacterized protein n=1 Tax=Pedobacter cryoconitis TaxID=188932 RepID=A0A7X0J1P1_9SPHI|nr:hypothetical protein [Pedobacter cryoconitis]
MKYLDLRQTNPVDYKLINRVIPENISYRNKRQPDLGNER